MKPCLNLVVVLAFAVATTVQDDMQGLSAPDPTKTCISIRLPWNAKPMYFCTDKTKFHYKDQCQDRYSNNCGINSVRQNMLMIATPWECCPTVLDPDSCANQQCAAPPLNRDCRELTRNPLKTWECCPNYFCEANATPQMCHFMQLDPACNTPPEGKTNCIAFVDPFGCCLKFQCDEDSKKPGECPAQVEASKIMARFNNTNATFDGPNPVPEIPLTTPIPEFAEEYARAEDLSYVQSNTDNIPCIGDFNCPGRLKCCSTDRNVYLQDGRYTYRNRNPTNGYCTEPADKDKDKKP